MGINIADNFAYNGKKPMDNRTEYTTLAAMKAVVDANINEGCMCYNKEDGKYYTFKSTNTVDATTGKWREFETGGGGQTYNDFTGATASTAGAHGLVPAPSAGDEGKVLFGNGLWGALPSVDLSGLSPEAFQFSLTEKVVGQWIDGKPLYQKVFTGLNASLNTSDWNTVCTIADLDLLINGWALYNNVGTGKMNIVQFKEIEPESSGIVIKAQLNGSRTINTAVFQYTKTTDSPLPSDVKFAGLLANGTVVYKKTVASGGSAPSGTTLIYRLALLNSTDVVYFTR